MKSWVSLFICSLGLHPGQQLQLHEIAAACGCSYQAIHQIEQRAMRKLRRLVAASGITKEDLPD